MAEENMQQAMAQAVQTGMTLTSNKFNCVKLYNPTMDIGQERTFYIQQGPTDYTTQYYTANSYNNSTISFVCTTPSPNCILDRRIFLIYTVYLQDLNSINPTALPTPLSQAAFDSASEGLRPWPMTSASTSMSLSLNGVNFAWQPDRAISALGHFYNTGDIWQDSSCPVLSEQYNSLFTIFGAIPFGGNSRNQFNNYYQDNFSWNGTTRNLFNYGGRYQDPVNTGITSSLNIVYTCVEPVVISPLDFGGKNEPPGLYGVSQLTLTYSFDPGRLWESGIMDTGANGVNIPRVMGPGNSTNIFANPTPNLFANNPPQLVIRYLTLPLTMKIPVQMSWPLFNVDLYQSPSTPALAGPGVTGTNVNSGPAPLGMITSSVITLNSIPSRIVLYVMKSINSSITTPQTFNGVSSLLTPNFNVAGYCDTFAIIQNISILFNNKSGIMSNATTEQLYTISCVNGLYDISFPQYTCGSYQGTGNTPFLVGDSGEFQSALRPGPGSVVCLSANELSLGADLAPSCLGNYNLQVKVTFASPLPWSQDWQLMILVISEGILSYNVGNGTFQKEIGVISSNQVINAPIGSPELWKTNRNLYGGSFFSKLKSLGQKALGFVKPIASAVTKLAPVVSNIAAEHGYSGIANAANIASNLADKAANVATHLGYGAMRHRRMRRSLSRRRVRGRGQLREEDLL